MSNPKESLDTQLLRQLIGLCSSIVQELRLLHARTPTERPAHVEPPHTPAPPSQLPFGKIPAGFQASERCTRLRHKHDWTQAQLAQYLGVSRNTVAQIECRRQGMSKRVLKAITHVEANGGAIG